MQWKRNERKKYFYFYFELFGRALIQFGRIVCVNVVRTN